MNSIFRLKIKFLIKEYGITKQFLVDLIGSNRRDFKKKIEGELDFTDKEKRILKDKYKFFEVL